MTQNDILIVIPARYASERFPGKPLQQLRGPASVSRPLIEWTWRVGVKALGRDNVVIATDDHRIGEVAEKLGARWVMTSASARNGTERCAEAIKQLGNAPPPLVVNLQGDSPLVPPHFIHALINKWRSCSAQVVTAYVDCDETLSQRIESEYRANGVGATTVVTSANAQALYFSKAPIPHRRLGNMPIKMHLGLYAYTPDALRTYCSVPPTALEDEEGLEQIRFLDLGIPVHTVEVSLPPSGLWEVNNPEDVAIVEDALQAI